MSAQVRSRTALILAVLAVTGCATLEGGTAQVMSSLKQTGRSIAQAGQSMFDSPGDKAPIITDMKPGPYEPSTLAVGEEKDLARQRGEALGFVRSEPLRQYLARIRTRILRASGVTDVPGQVVILANPAFGAYSTPDGNVYLAMGWFPYLGSEDEVAAIIAHELGHILLKHHSADLVSGFQKRAQAAHELGLAAKMTIANRPPSKDDQRTLLGSQVLAGVSDNVVMPAWGRRQETAADLMGIDLLIRAGYSPVAMATMLEKYQAWEKQTQQDREALRSRAGEVMRSDWGDEIKAVWNRTVESLAASHPETSQRLSDVAGYLDRHYGDASLPALQTVLWTEIRGVPEVREVLRNYDLAFSARKLLEGGKSRDAYAYARDATGGRTATHAYPNWMLAQAAVAVGRSSEAVTALNRAIDANEPLREVYDAMILVREQRGDLAGALAWTDKASSIFGDAARWTPTRIRLLRKSGRVDEASAVALKCTLETPEWRQLCQQANQTPVQRAGR